MRINEFNEIHDLFLFYPVNEKTFVSHFSHCHLHILLPFSTTHTHTGEGETTDGFLPKDPLMVNDSINRFYFFKY
jgi:hypothetical protein